MKIVVYRFMLLIDGCGFLQLVTMWLLCGIKSPQSRKELLRNPHTWIGTENGPFLTRISRVVSYTSYSYARSTYYDRSYSSFPSFLPTPWHEILFHRSTNTTIVKFPSSRQVWPRFWL